MRIANLINNKGIKKKYVHQGYLCCLIYAGITIIYVLLNEGNTIINYTLTEYSFIRVNEIYSR